jgi:membrane protease YdiL (CAAX protease family)
VTTSLALVATLVVLAAVNLWVHVGPSRWQPVTGPLLAVGLLLLGRGAGLSWEQLGLGRESLVPGLVWGGVAVALVIAGYAVGLAVPAWRGLFLDARHAVGPLRAARRAFVVVPLGVVVFEEVAFRGVLWGLVGVEHGTMWATAVTSMLFGLWHVLPAVDGARANAAGPDAATDGDAGMDGGAGTGRAPVPPGILARQVVGTVAFTALAGAVFAVLRDQSGSLVAPFLLHWAANGLGILAAAWAWTVHAK